MDYTLRACYGVLRFVMESGAKGCEVVVSGKLRAARAKSMKFTDGFMIHSGQPARDFVDYAVRHVLLKQGVLGIKVKMSVIPPHVHPAPHSTILFRLLA
jgi:ribosomal protein S3